MNEHEDDLPISALQHLLFCERQCALIHVERLWADNIFTAEGELMHERTHRPGKSGKGPVRIERGLQLRSEQLGLYGVADIVEFHQGEPRPVEYKRGKPKTHRADEVQLCAQALCLEEMFNTRVLEADLYYGRTRRRQTVCIDDDLRHLTEEAVRSLRELLKSNVTPPPVYDRKRCSACSLRDICLPRKMKSGRSASRYVASLQRETSRSI